MAYHDSFDAHESKRPGNQKPEPDDKTPGWMWAGMCFILLLALASVCGLGNYIRMSATAADASPPDAAR